MSHDDNDMSRSLRVALALELGIAPLASGSDVRKDVSRELAKLPPDESRRMRRRFRKLWRREARRTAALLGTKSLAKCGCGSPAPTRRQKLERKWMMLMTLYAAEQRLRRGIVSQEK